MGHSSTTTGTVRANGIDLWYESFGDPEDPPLLLVMGLGGQAISWPDALCWGFVGRGFRVVRFDNRDAGLSTGFDDHPVDIGALATQFFGGGPIDAPYRLSDMAADAVGLLDALGIDRAHVVGTSLGGMIAQTIAIEHRSRVQTLTSIMSTTGDPALALPEADVVNLLLASGPVDRDGAVEHAVLWATTIGSQEHLDLDVVRDLAGRSFDRSFRPSGVVRQLAAILASGSREQALQALDLPTLVIHGTADRLIRPDGGRRTAELVPGAELVEVDGMGHDLPQAFWGLIIEQVTALVARSYG